MKENKKILAIIPARGGSKGIPKKNVRLLAGKPLIAYSIETALKSKYINKVVVSTDDEEIAEISKIYGAEVIKRPRELARDDITLDIVIHHAVINIENGEDYFDVVITLQPTSPLLSTETLDRAIETLFKSDYDTIISVSDETHLYWREENRNYVPLYKERKNRQFLSPIYKETGAFVISKREVIKEGSRIGKKLFLYKIPEKESVDIDSIQDWWIAENYVNMLKIVIRVDGDYDMGLGHVYRALTLANRMSFHHNVYFLLDENKRLGIKKVREYHYPVYTFKSQKEMIERIKEMSPHIVINDILDTSQDYIRWLKEKGYFVVNFEDLGDGSDIADIVINALYENSYPPSNHYYGYRYVCLRDEFYIFPPRDIKKNVNRILVTFGGTDPNNLTIRTMKAIESLGLKEIEIKVILGLGCRDKKMIYEYAENLSKEGFKIGVRENVRIMAKEMRDADIVVTSNGRTIYETASMGIPCISIAQNERESTHLFVRHSKCIVYLGMASNIEEIDIKMAIKKLIKDYKLRREMSKKCLKYNIREGIKRVEKIIIERYRDWKKNSNRQ